MLFENLKGCSEMVKVLFIVRAVYHDIIKEYQNKSPQVRLKNVIHEGLEGRWCIGQPKRHYKELIVSFMSSKSSFGYIFQMHPYLPIA